MLDAVICTKLKESLDYLSSDIAPGHLSPVTIHHGPDVDLAPGVGALHHADCLYGRPVLVVLSPALQTEHAAAPAAPAPLPGVSWSPGPVKTEDLGKPSQHFVRLDQPGPINISVRIKT